MVEKKNKVAVVTITNGPCNYGNMLQNYAVVKTIEKLKIEVETLYNIEDASYLVSKKHKIKNYLYKYAKIGDYLNAERELNFFEFGTKYLNYSKPCLDSLNSNIINRYEYFIAGSDQVWNPKFSGKMSHWKYLLLGFAPEHKRVAYAPSIGVSEIPKDYERSFKDEVSKFKALSIREDKGKEIIKELVHKDAKVLIDPTMMLSKNEWEKVMKKPKKVNTDEKYILTYFLGGRTQRIDADLQSYQNNLNAKCYHMLDKNQKDVYVSGPAEFIYMIKNAELILTDSFHACVFAFLFKKPFLVYSRQGQEQEMMSRIDTLLTKFNINRKFVDSGINNELLEANYENGYEILDRERKKAIEFLKEALAIE